MQVLKDRGLEDDTIVVFISDNGMSFPFAKINCYQASLRIPFIIRYPRLVQAGTHDQINMVSAVDLAPTLIELAGLPVPETMAGRSFVPLLESKDQEARDYVIGYYYRNIVSIRMYPEFAVHMRDWTYIYNPWVDGRTEVHNSDYTNSPSILAMWEASMTNTSIRERTEFHKYRIREELYFVRDDPDAYVNLAALPEHRAQVEAMQRLLVQWMVENEHPALTLMKDPYNEDLISKYMAFEVCTARVQVDRFNGIPNDTVCPVPTLAPVPTATPTSIPTISTAPSSSPTVSAAPSSVPTTSFPTDSPSTSPTNFPTVSAAPSGSPSSPPTNHPTVSVPPSDSPTVSLAPSSSIAPSEVPTISIAPSALPSVAPSALPSVAPSALPSTLAPTGVPSTSFVPTNSSLDLESQTTPSSANGMSLLVIVTSSLATAVMLSEVFC